jgi:hypothetical protein
MVGVLVPSGFIWLRTILLQPLVITVMNLRVSKEGGKFSARTVSQLVIIENRMKHEAYPPIRFVKICPNVFTVDRHF